RLVRIESVEELVHFFLALSRRSDLLPYVRSLLMSVFISDGRVQLSQPLSAFTRRAIREVSLVDHADQAAEERADLFCGEAARMLVDWLRTLCQNPPRQRRIALKYVGGWDSLQGEAEQLDVWLYLQRHAGATEQEAGDPLRNAYGFSSWAYHMKLVLMGGALMAGIRLCVYQAHEFPMVFCYATQVFEAHTLHLHRMIEMLAAEKQGGEEEITEGLVPQWTARRVGGSECRAQLERWLAVARAQKELATALWLVSHACERLGVGGFVAPWARRSDHRLALEVSRRLGGQDAQAARFALRFRALSRLNSPPPLAFDAWLETRAQVDEHPIADLFVHAKRLLADAKAAMDRAKPAFSPDNQQMLLFRAVYYVVLANSVALAKLLDSDAISAPALAAVTGAEADVFRQTLLSEALTATAGRAKQRGGGKKKKGDVAARAREWVDDVDRLVSSGLLNVSWTTAADRHPDWPVFSFIP
ncbi:N-alpha-acetyltransferase, non-catalitic subunit, partial [Coemansia aciculifera]